MNNSDHLNDEIGRDLDKIAKIIATLPDISPPEGLLEAVMKRIRPKRIGYFRRLWRALHFPIALIMVTPLRLAYLTALATIFIISTLVMMLEFSGDNRSEKVVEKVNRINVPIVFTLDMPQASKVGVIGSFNGWSPADYHMQWDPDKGLWVLRVHLNAGTYEYAFLVNGKNVIPDPGAPAYREDGFGNKNSILIVNRDKDNGNHI